MEAYTDFAGVYDQFMDDTPYEEWAAYIIYLLKTYESPETAERVYTEALAAERNIIVDLGCGTGTLTNLLADAGYDMIGIDSSQEMLQLALSKKEKTGKEILYLNQDMRELELYGTVGAIVSVCDSIAENRDECSFIWENYYDSESEINEYDVTVFVRTVGTDVSKQGEELFRRFSETHYQRGYTVNKMRTLLEKAGMKFVTAIDADTHGEIMENSERIYIVAREAGKERANQ